MAKTIKDTPEAAAGLVVGTNAARLMGKRDHYVAVDERGTTINGPVSFVSSPQQIRMGGLWTFNNPLTMSIPSTLATPSPVLIVNPPVKQVASLMKDAVIMMGLLATLSTL